MQCGKTKKKMNFFEKLCPEMSRSGNLYYRGENDPCTRRHSYEIVICGCRIGQSHPEILPEWEVSTHGLRSLTPGDDRGREGEKYRGET